MCVARNTMWNRLEVQLVEYSWVVIFLLSKSGWSDWRK